MFLHLVVRDVALLFGFSLFYHLMKTGKDGIMNRVLTTWGEELKSLLSCCWCCGVAASWASAALLHEVSWILWLLFAEHLWNKHVIIFTGFILQHLYRRLFHQTVSFNLMNPEDHTNMVSVCQTLSTKHYLVSVVLLSWEHWKLRLTSESETNTEISCLDFLMLPTVWRTHFYVGRPAAVRKWLCWQVLLCPRLCLLLVSSCSLTSGGRRAAASLAVSLKQLITDQQQMSGESQVWVWRCEELPSVCI